MQDGELSLELIRSTFLPERTFGRLLHDGVRIGYTLEDTVRKPGAAKVNGKTAIPAGHYQVLLTFSQRFQKVMPEVLAVPGFMGIRIHGGNTEADTLGCPLLGTQTDFQHKVWDCQPALGVLMELLVAHGGRGWLTVR